MLPFASDNKAFMGETVQHLIFQMLYNLKDSLIEEQGYLLAFLFLFIFFNAFNELKYLPKRQPLW